MNGAGVSLALTDEAVEAIAQRAAEILRASDEPAPRWLTGAQAAAAYLDWPTKRVHNRIHELPHHRNGGRLMFNSAELDDYVRSAA